jgi:hypothetical protein
MPCQEESRGKLEEPYGRYQTCKSGGGCFQGKKSFNVTIAFWQGKGAHPQHLARKFPKIKELYEYWCII